jgi:hypothetical protein
MKKSTDIFILIDADVVSHFIVGGYITVLPRIFPYKIKILDKVYQELVRTPKKKIEVNNLIDMKLFTILPFPENDEQIKKEFLRLMKLEFKGEGESACMAVVRYSKNILASSNLRDIANYCKMHQLQYLTTMDFLCEALRTNIMSLKDCNEFLNRAKLANQKMPVYIMENHICREIHLQ